MKKLPVLTRSERWQVTLSLVGGWGPSLEVEGSAWVSRALNWASTDHTSHFLLYLLGCFAGQKFRRTEKLFISQSWGIVRRNVRGANVYGSPLYLMCFSHAMFFNTREKGIHHLYFRGNVCIHIRTGTASLVLIKCSVNIYGMNYSSNRDLYNFAHLTYLYIYTKKKCLYCTFTCRHMNDKEIAPLGFVEYDKNFSRH